jgi:hypothetical protein
MDFILPSSGSAARASVTANATQVTFTALGGISWANIFGTDPLRPVDAEIMIEGTVAYIRRAVDQNTIELYAPWTGGAKTNAVFNVKLGLHALDPQRVIPALTAILRRDIVLAENFLAEFAAGGATAQANARTNLGLGTIATKDFGAFNENLLMAANKTVTPGKDGTGNEVVRFSQLRAAAFANFGTGANDAATGNHTHAISSVTDLTQQLAAKASLLELNRVRGTIVYPEQFGAVGDGSTIDTQAFRDMANALRRTLPNRFTLPEIYIDGQGKTYAIDDTIVFENTPFIHLDRMQIRAVGNGWNSSKQMFSFNGTTAVASTGVILGRVAFDGSKVAGGAYRLENSPRSIISDKVNVVHCRGALGIIGQSNWLSIISGTYHEWEGYDAEWSNPALRQAIGLYSLPSGPATGNGAGDVYFVNTKIGWIKTCVLDEAPGPTKYYGGHWYNSAQPQANAMLGTVIEFNKGGGSALLDGVYLDTGALVYKSGFVNINGGNEFFHLPDATPAALDYYIEMVATGPGQYHNLTIQAPTRTDRSKRLVKVTETGGNTWANIPNSWREGNTNILSSQDTLVVTSNAFTTVPARFESAFSGVFVGLRDKDTTVFPSIGAFGNNLVLSTANRVPVEVTAAGHVNLSGAGLFDALVRFKDPLSSSDPPQIRTNGAVADGLQLLANGGFTVTSNTGSPSILIDAWRANDGILQDWSNFGPGRNHKYRIYSDVEGVATTANTTLIVGTTGNAAVKFLQNSNEALGIYGDVIVSNRPIRFASYTTGTLPSASAFFGCIVFNSTTFKLVGSDGSAWLNIH